MKLLPASGLLPKIAIAAALLLVPMTPVSQPAMAQGPASVADLAEGLLGSVVNISTSRKVSQRRPNIPIPNQRKNSPFQDFFDELFPNEPGNRPNQRRNPQRRSSLGSGFVIDAKGIVITNNHVIADADEIIVNFPDGSKYTAELVGKDPKVDIAVLRFKPDRPIKAVKFGDSSKARIGDWVMAIGNPFGLGSSVSLGIVSAFGRDIRSGPYDNFIQTDAAINRGNSGGPLFNMKGEVIGINTAIISPSGGSIGIGFSIPSELATKVIDQLIKYGETRRGWLGVQIQTVSPEIAETLGMDKAKGALVGDVVPGGPADDAKIKSGDVILSFDGKDVVQMRDLPRIVADTDIDKAVNVVVLRKGEELTLDVKVGRLEDGEKKMASLEDPKKEEPRVAKVLGMQLSPITDALRESEEIGDSVKGVLVQEVDKNSNAADKGIRKGDVIVEVGQEAVRNAKQLEARIEALRKEKRRNALMMVSTKTGDIRFVVVRIN